MSESIHCRSCFELIDKTVKKASTKLSDKLKKYEMNVAQLFCDCTGISLNDKSLENDVICVSCKQSLVNFYEFRKRAFDTDKKFKKLKESVNVPVEVKIEEEIKMEVEAWVPEIIVKKEKALPQKDRKYFRSPYRKEDLQKYTKNADGLYECPKEYCSGLFKQAYRLLVHLENIHPDTDQKSFACEHCGEEFTTLLLRKQHNYKFHAPRPYKCDLCDKDYPFYNSLRYHILNTHLKSIKKEKVEVPCTTCGKYFSGEGGMLRHRKQVHFPKELQEKRYICTVCGSRWATRAKLVAHATCHESASLICDMCNKSYTSKRAIYSHMKTVHIADRPFFCDLCGKRCKTRFHLQNHQATAHNDERPHKCALCPSTFKLKSGLQEHIKETHTTKTPLPCEICGKLFKTKDSMKHHMTIHKPPEFECLHCDMKHRTKELLRLHVRTIHLGFKKRSSCTICLLNLSSRKQIMEHLMQNHKDAVAGKKMDDFVSHYWTTDPSGLDLGEPRLPKGKFWK